MNPAHEPIRIPIVFTGDDPDMTAIVAHAMTSARAAQGPWSRTPIKHRLQLVRELRHLIAMHARQLAGASASARQRSAVESLTAEVLPLVEACRFLELHAKKLLRPKKLGRRGLPLWLAGVRTEIQRAPLGVILIIGPGNYPLLLPGVQLIQALVAGNAVLLKPGLGGLPAARELVELVIRAGFDPRLVALLPESAEAARIAIHSRPDKLVFTGSSTTGEAILAQLAPHLIPSTMELSGNDAVIIRADADLDLVVKALTFGLTLNAGATCMSPKRAFVHRSLATELEGRLAQYFSPSRMSPAFNPANSSQGPVETVSTPVISDSAGKPGSEANNLRLRTLINEALASGAHFITGDIENDGTVTTPAVLAGVSPASPLLREDIFAPVLSIVTVADDREAVMRANDSPLALTVSIFSRDEEASRSLASQVQAGVVTINDIIVPTADARIPFGGRKRSGFGVTRGAEGLLELTTTKVVTISRGKFRPAFEPPEPADEQMFEAYLQLTHCRGLKSRWAMLVSLIRSITKRSRNLSKDKP